jgi:hypothetical protein
MRLLIAVAVALLFAGFSFADHDYNDTEKIDYCGTIYSKVYVKAKMSDGKYLCVPVVNGYLPSIDEDYANGRYHRTYSYTKRVKYVSGVTPNYSGAAGSCRTDKDYSTVSAKGLPRIGVTEERSYDRSPSTPPATMPRASDDYPSQKSSSLPPVKYKEDELRSQIRSLRDELEKKDKEIEELRSQIRALREELDKLKKGPEKGPEKSPEERSSPLPKDGQFGKVEGK